MIVPIKVRLMDPPFWFVVRPLGGSLYTTGEFKSQYQLRLKAELQTVIFYGDQWPLRITAPGNRPVGLPFSNTGSPFTKTWSIPSDNSSGSLNVDRSMTLLGSKMTRSAFIPSRIRPRSFNPSRDAGA